MARQESKAIAGYLPLLPQHHAAVTSLLAPATPATKLLDPYAGFGEFAEVAASAWNVTAYTNELVVERAAVCRERFGDRAVQCDVNRLIASNNAFGIGWFNPPYDQDKLDTTPTKRVEFAYLRHSWKWICNQGIIFWCVYSQHITDAAALFLAKNATQVDIWALPGKHLGQYDQFVVVAIKGINPNPDPLYELILAQRAAPRLLTPQAEPLYTVPAPPKGQHVVFAPDVIDETLGQHYIDQEGAWTNSKLQEILRPHNHAPAQIQSIVAPRPGHTTLVLAAGMTDGAIIDTEAHGRIAIRGTTRPVEEISSVVKEESPENDGREITKTTTRLTPKTTITLLTENGTITELKDDTALIDFISANQVALTRYIEARFNPVYSFDLNGMSRYLDGIRLNGKHPLYIAQKHVIAAIAKGFETRKGILLVGQMGTGKTAVAASVTVGMGIGAAQRLYQQMSPDEVILIVCPPHLAKKWEREARSIHSLVHIEQIARHEDLKTFMANAQRLGPGIAKIGIIKRDMTKLGSGYEPAVVWSKHYTPLWPARQPRPYGYDQDQPRITTKLIPRCPHCSTIVREDKGGEEPPLATATYLKTHKLTCPNCHHPLWQEARDNASKPKAGELYPRKNTRYALDEYLKRRYGNRVHLLIWDEVHEAQNGDRGNGRAFGRMAGVAKHVLAMTGTPFNGYASSTFNLEYHLNPRIAQRYNWGGADRYERKPKGARSFATLLSSTSNRGEAESQWVRDMGVRTKTSEERPTYDSDTGAFVGMSTYERPYTEAPGISPLLVAETMDHTIFFSLTDMAEGLPNYEELAIPVPLDTDAASEYDKTMRDLKDYLARLRFDGDNTFLGAYFHWSVDRINSTFRPYDIIHNRRMRDGRVNSSTVRQLPSLGENRIYTKEQTLLDIINDELAQARPCVIYFRQTNKNDLQPRIEQLIKKNVPNAKPYILTQKVQSDRREKVIDQAIADGHNVILCNPELVKTGLDLVFAGTLIFYEPVFSLSTMMQASGRNYRLSQKQFTHCKVIHLYYENTMEAAAIELMSRKQRAAKLLLGETGLTGLEALTADEGSFEQALMQNITESTTVDPSALFKTRDDTKIIDQSDLNFWKQSAASQDADDMPADDLFAAATSLGANITALHPVAPEPRSISNRAINDYLDQALYIADTSKRAKLAAHINHLIHAGDKQAEPTIIGIDDPDFARYDVNYHILKSTLIRLIRGHAPREEESAIANRVIELAKVAAGQQDAADIFDNLKIGAATEAAQRVRDPLQLPPMVTQTKHDRSLATITTLLTTKLQLDANSLDTFEHRDVIAAIIEKDKNVAPEILERDLRVYLIKNNLASRDAAATFTSALLNPPAPVERKPRSQPAPKPARAQTFEERLNASTPNTERFARLKERRSRLPEATELKQQKLFA